MKFYLVSRDCMDGALEIRMSDEWAQPHRAISQLLYNKAECPTFDVVMLYDTCNAVRSYSQFTVSAQLELNVGDRLTHFPSLQPAGSH